MVPAGPCPAPPAGVTEHERAAEALLEAELELQAAVRAQLRRDERSRNRLARAKLRMYYATRRAYRPLGVPMPSTESGPPDYGLRRIGAEAAAASLTLALTRIEAGASRASSA